MESHLTPVRIVIATNEATHDKRQQKSGEREPYIFGEDLIRIATIERMGFPWNTRSEAAIVAFLHMDRRPLNFQHTNLCAEDTSSKHRLWQKQSQYPRCSSTNKGNMVEIQWPQREENLSSVIRHINLENIMFSRNRNRETNVPWYHTYVKSERVYCIQVVSWTVLSKGVSGWGIVEALANYSYRNTNISKIGEHRNTK